MMYDVDLIVKSVVRMRVEAKSYQLAQLTAEREFLLSPFGRPQRILEAKPTNAILVLETAG